MHISGNENCINPNKDKIHKQKLGNIKKKQKQKLGNIRI